jgi:hypothetical protein
MNPMRIFLPLIFAGILIYHPSAFAQETNRNSSIQVLDLDSQNERQVIVDREKGQYLGHPTTVLLEDGKTILCVYPKGHGKGPIQFKRSDDGGKSWSDRLPTPKNWETSLETPTIHRVIDASGKKRLILFSGLHPVRMAYSEDDGNSWSELKKVGDWGGIVTMASVISIGPSAGNYLALFHDDGRFFGANGKANGVFTLYQSRSSDGGLTWDSPTAIYRSSEVHLCEPGAVRSPDGKQIAVLLRENRRDKNSHIIFSDDEGKSWSEPKELPLSLCGDRHVAKYLPDGRLFISFRAVQKKTTANAKDELSKSMFAHDGDWVAWVGLYEDLRTGGLGQYRIRLKDNKNRWDCAYPGVEILPDGTIVTTTYGHWDQGEAPYLLSIRISATEIDAIAKEQVK